MFARRLIAAWLVALNGVLISTAPAQTLSLGTNPQGSLAYATGSAISKVGIEKANLRIRVPPQGGPSNTVPLVNSGELDFSIVLGMGMPTVGVYLLLATLVAASMIIVGLVDGAILMFFRLREPALVVTR